MTGRDPEDERRIHPRYVRSIELSGSPHTGGASARLIATNLSLGGLYCTSDRDYPEMTRLAVRMILSEPLEVSAVVVRHKKLAAAGNGAQYELALLFTSLNPVQRERLARVIAHP